MSSTALWTGWAGAASATRFGLIAQLVEVGGRES